MARRLLSIWFPRLASDISLRARPVEGPFAVTHRAGNADHLHCLNVAASDLGLQRGMALADARAICPDLTTRPSDLGREGLMLRQLRRWAGRYAPQVAVDGADGLMADISGVPHLFGGEEALRVDVLAGLCRAGLTAQCAIAGTRGAAYALARFAGGGIAAEGALAAGLGPLPIAALRVDHDTVAALGRLGLRRIADLIPMQRAPLARRFGQGLIMRLDQALGQHAEPVAAPLDVPHFAVRMTLPEPIGKQDDVMAGLARLLARLCSALAQHGMGARRLRFEMRRVDGQAARLDIGLARPMRDPARMAALFVKGVDDVDAGFGIDALRLSATLVEPMPPEQMGAGTRLRDENALADLMSSLGNRIGFDRVQRIERTQSLIPERSFQMVSAASVAAPIPALPRRGPPRPAIIFAPELVSDVSGNPPTRFRWRRMHLTTQRAIGPERITPEWWLDDPAWRTGLRDYWCIQTQQGPRLWLFHTPQSPRWCVQGEFI
jgi:protein ImuB